MIPAERLRPRCRHVLTLMGVLLVVCASVEAQTKNSAVLLRGVVSETVALSVFPNPGQSSVEVDTVKTGSTVRLTLSGADAESSVIRMPVLVRSNIAFKISAAFESETAGLSELAVVDARAMGTLVSPDVVKSLEFDRHHNSDLSRPLLVLTGPRVSLGGTLQAPNNALEITLLIRVKPSQPQRGWTGHLTLVATAESPVQ